MAPSAPRTAAGWGGSSLERSPARPSRARPTPTSAKLCFQGGGHSAGTRPPSSRTWSLGLCGVPGADGAWGAHGLLGFGGESTSLHQRTARMMSWQETTPGGPSDPTGKDLPALKRQRAGPVSAASGCEQADYRRTGRSGSLGLRLWSPDAARCSGSGALPPGQAAEPAGFCTSPTLLQGLCERCVGT